MTPQPGFTTMSNCGNMNEFNENDVPKMLSGAWAVCSSTDLPLRDQLNNDEKAFLIEFAKYIEDSMTSPIAATEPETVLNDILMTAGHRYSHLTKETSLSPGHVAILTLLHLMKNLFASDNMKYQSLESFLAAYPAFTERSIAEQEKLFHTANWMNILFKITTAKKNKGLVMIVIPKLVEGSGVQYVTGSGQTQPTRDRVTLYETEGNVKPIKRLQRKSKRELMEMAKESSGKSKKTTKKKATYTKKKSLRDGTYHGNTQQKTIVVRGRRTRTRGTVHETHSLTDEYSSDAFVKYESNRDYESYVDIDDEEGSELRKQQIQPISNSKNNYHPLPPPMFNLAPPVPVCRSQSSFSQAATFISNNQTGANAPTSFVKSPKECYVNVESNGIRKTSSANWSSLFSSPPATEDQLDMFRETSEDSDISGDSGQCFPPHLFHQTSGTLEVANILNCNGNSLGSPNPQPRALERIHSASLESNHGEVDMELLEKEFLDGGAYVCPEPHWLSRSTSASSLTESLHVNG